MWWERDTRKGFSEWSGRPWGGVRRVPRREVSVLLISLTVTREGWFSVWRCQTVGLPYKLQGRLRGLVNVHVLLLHAKEDRCSEESKATAKSLSCYGKMEKGGVCKQAWAIRFQMGFQQSIQARYPCQASAWKGEVAKLKENEYYSSHRALTCYKPHQPTDISSSP